MVSLGVAGSAAIAARAADAASAVRAGAALRRRWGSVVPALGLALALGACGSLSPVGADGSSQAPVFPDPQRASPAGGLYPHPGNLALIRAGMSKAQIQALLGPPHFSEGVFGVREWDYLLQLPDGADTRACQYKILFDRERIARSFHWRPQQCAAAAAVSPR